MHQQPDMGGAGRTLERQARSLLARTGARVTAPRVRVMTYLLAQRQPRSRGDIARGMDGAPLGGVNLYRVLAWLTANGLVHRIAGADAARRYSASAGSGHDAHAHFQCLECGSLTCLPDVPVPASMVMPPGFTQRETTLLVKGTCPECSDRSTNMETARQPHRARLRV